MEIQGLSPSPYSAGLYPRKAEGVTPSREQGREQGITEQIKERNAQATRQEAPEQKRIQQADNGPRIQFKDNEGTRVMEVYDHKSVLIYQVPPKGMLMLIRAQETRQGIETSA